MQGEPFAILPINGHMFTVTLWEHIEGQGWNWEARFTNTDDGDVLASDGTFLSEGDALGNAYDELLGF